MDGRRIIEILIVDDSEGVCAAVSMLLEDEGYGTQTVSTYDGALEQVKQSHFDLVLIDAHLGTRSGIKLARELRAAGASPKIVLMSGAFLDHDFTDVPVLQKPFSRQELLECVRSVMKLAA